MRGDGVGVGDIGEVPGVAWRTGDAAGGDDGRGDDRKHDAGMDGGLGRTQWDASGEPRRDGIGVGDGAWVEHGVGGVLSPVAAGTHGMRGDGVGVGDVGEVPGGARGAGYAESRSHWRRAQLEHDAGDVL